MARKPRRIPLTFWLWTGKKTVQFLLWRRRRKKAKVKKTSEKHYDYEAKS